jgi:CBS domain-containing protein
VPDAFRFETPPFDCLNPAEQATLLEATVRVALQHGSVFDAEASAHPNGYVIVSGHVEELWAGNSAVYGPGEYVGFLNALTGASSGQIIALEDTIAWKVPQATLQVLLAGNARFSAMVLAELSRRLSAAVDGGRQREFLSLMTGQVRDVYLRKPFLVDGSLDVVSVCRLMSGEGLTSALVRDGAGEFERIGMFTTTDLRDALLSPTPPAQLAVREVASFDLITVDADAEIFEALLQMIRHRVHRVLVRDGEAILGILSQLELMSFVSNHSHLIALRVGEAQSVEELRDAMGQVDDMIALLHRDGVRIDVISSLVSELNSQVFSRLWQLLAPADLVRNSCLVVMGSEGRGEQVLKTDQDNALLVRDGFHCAALAEVADAFSAALTTFGYPPCPGKIMVCNPYWRQAVTSYRDTVRDWVHGSDANGPMNLAIFMDARAVAGDASLLGEVRRYALRILSDSDAYFARFVEAVNLFNEPSTGWWSRLTSGRMNGPEVFDLKKLGTFPIVHGVRTLALEQRLEELGTAERLRVLAGRGVVTDDLARDLREALHFLMALKLRINLRQRQLGHAMDNLVRLDSLGTLDRDQLKDSVSIVRRFRQHLALHYKLES